MSAKLAANYATLTIVPLVMLFIIYLYVQLKRIPFTGEWIIHRIKSVFVNDISAKKRMETSGSFDACNNREIVQLGHEIPVNTPKSHIYYKVYAHEHPKGQIQVSNHFQQI